MKFVDLIKALMGTSLLDYYVEHPTDDIVMRIPVRLRVADFQMVDLVEATEIQLKSELIKMQYETVANIEFDLQLSDDAEDHDVIYGIDCRLADQELLFNYPLRRRSEFLYKESSVMNNDVPFFMTQTILHQIFHGEFNRLKTSNFGRNNGIVTYLDDYTDRDSLSLNLVGFNDSRITSQLEELGKLYSLQFQYDQPILEDQITIIHVEGEEENVFTLNNHIIVQGSSTYDYEYDLKKSLFEFLGIPLDPSVFSLQIDSQARFGLVMNMLKFVEILNDKRLLVDSKQMESLFKERQQILKIARDCEWGRLLKMSRTLVNKVASIDQTIV